MRCERPSGSWGTMESSVNELIDDLLWPTAEVTRSIAAVAKGDLSQTVTLEVEGRLLEGEFLRSAQIVNTMIQQLDVFTSEVTRVAREVGAEGKLGGQALVHDVSGVWRDLTDNVNSMANNLTSQVRNISEVTIAVANGDLSRKITVDSRGEILQLKEAINTMVDQLRSFASEVTRVAREVGTEGKLGGQATVPGVAGTWKDLTDNVNVMAANLTDQVRGIAEVATAIARGDLSRKITVDVQGEILALKDTINTMVDQLRSFASEVTRVAREVGTEGKLGGQAKVPDVAGTWKDLTDNVNSMAGNLTGQVRNIAAVATAVARGDLSRKVTVDVKGEILELKDTINTMVEQLRSFASEVTRVAREVGTEGKLGGQAKVPGVAGTWKDLTDNVNVMATNLTDQVRGIAEVAIAIARGDLSRKITVDVQGEILALKDTFNTMVDQLNGFAAEVTRVAREVGTEGKLGGQAKVPGVAGTWKDLTDNVNSMAGNLTAQVRNIAEVTTAVARGDLSRKITVDVQGELLALKDTINTMVDQLNGFAAEVTRVAREVGVEGRLGGQAYVPGAAGTWKDLTANVNLLAANLTTQVRAIADVATAVTNGDLTRYIQVDASGEVADLKNYINAMIGNLRETTERNTEQDWLKTNLAKFSRMMQGQRDLHTVAHMLLNELAPLVEAAQGVMYVMVETERGPRLRQVAAYADAGTDGVTREYRLGEGVVGQCAREGQRMMLTDFHEGSIRISSGLVDLAPRTVIVLPVLFETQVKAVIELASLNVLTASHTAFLEQLTDTVGVVLNNIEATMRTERLLAQSQQLASEQQSQQRVLRQTNEELAQKARLLAAQNAEVERKNEEIELARRAVEDKAAELALTSRYKSEFLANMSHELRTPLNSILVLGEQLAQNADTNLTPRQVEYAATIQAAGADLMNLISDILDLSKIESGTVTVEAEEFDFAALADTVERNFRHEADSRGLKYAVELDPGVGQTIRTDPKRLLQVLRNLLSNAFKFTEQGSVRLRVRPARGGWGLRHPVLDEAPAVVEFSVTDTGIGIPPEKQQIIFEAFQQADAGTARKHGGTGLGLAISRELAQLLGGEIRVDSEPSKGSVFRLYLPSVYAGSAVPSPSPRDSAEHTGDSNVYPILLRESEVPALVDDRDRIEEGDDVLLIIESATEEAARVLEMAHEHRFKGIVSTRGVDALACVRRYPVTGVVLALSLPDMLGWAVLSRLKQEPATRHLPVLLLGTDGQRHHALALGAFASFDEPLSPEELGQQLEQMRHLARRPKRDLLVVAADGSAQDHISRIVGGADIEITPTSSGIEALQHLARRSFDCVVLGLRLGDMSGLDLLAEARRHPALAHVPFVLYSESNLANAESARTRELARELVLRSVHSPARLLDESCLFLHRTVDDLSREQQETLRSLYESDESLAGKKVLVVDDDERNIFALSSVLERHRIDVLSAATGFDAIRLVAETPDIALVLLDIMMPDMDGYETLSRLRARSELQRLPVIALTAKAMKGDREKCLEAGASDYIAKPVDTRQLLLLLRAWLHR